MKRIILCVYPRAGLANKLLVLAKCYAHAAQENAIVTETLFIQLPLLSSILSLRQPRVYISCPVQKNLLSPIFWTIIYKSGLFNILRRFSNHFLHIKAIDYFDSYPLHMNPYKDLICDSSGLSTKASLHKRLGVNTKITHNFSAKPLGLAAVHIRQGDFTSSPDGVLRPNTRTDLSYYLKLISTLSSFYNMHAMHWSLKVYTDDKSELIGKIPEDESIQLCSGHPYDDFIDLITCDVLVPSPWSTFSGLAAHLSINKLVIVPDELRFQFEGNSSLTVVSPYSLHKSLNKYYFQTSL